MKIFPLTIFLLFLVSPAHLLAQSNGARKDPRTPPPGVVDLGSRGGGVDELGDSLNGALRKKEQNNKRISLTQKRLGEKPKDSRSRRHDMDPPSPASDRARELQREELLRERSAAGPRD